MTEKLIRDRIPEIAGRRGQHLTVRTAGPEEMSALTLAKLGEEYREVLAAGPDDLLDEIVDLIEVSYAVADAHGYDAAAVEEARDRKRKARGSFLRRLVLHLSD